MELLETPIILEFTITGSNFQFVCIRQHTFSFLTYGIFTTNILQQFIQQQLISYALVQDY